MIVMCMACRQSGSDSQRLVLIVIALLLMHVYGSICAKLINHNDKAYGISGDGVDGEDSANAAHRRHRRNDVPFVDKTYEKVLNNARYGFEHLKDTQKERTCILGTAELYLSYWVFANGTLNVPHAMIGRYALDLSFTPQTRYTLVEHIRDISNYDVAHSKHTSNAYNSTESPIQIMSAAFTNLTQVPNEALAIISDSLQFLSLKGNNFSQSFLDSTSGGGEIDENIIEDEWDRFPYLPELRELDLRNCLISVVKTETFKNVPNLQRLYMAHNRFNYITPDTFRHVPHLYHLDLSYNTRIYLDTYDEVTGDTKSIDPFSVVNDGLYLSDNIFTSLPALLFIDMSYTKIFASSARAFSMLPASVQMLSLCYTSLSLLSPAMFNGTQLSVLDLSGNPTLAYNSPTDALDGLANTLTILSVENSNLKSLNAFCKLRALKILQLRHNNINQLFPSTFAGLDAIEMLDLSSNHLSNWYARVFVTNPRLELLRLHDNNINLITTEMFRDFQQLRYLSIGSNGFICSCNLRSFMDVAVRNSRHFYCPEDVNVASIISTQLLASYGEDVKPSVLFASGPMQTALRDLYDIDLRISNENLMSLHNSHENIVQLKKQHLHYNVMMWRPEESKDDGGVTFVRHMIDGTEMDFQFQLIDFEEDRYKCINSTTNLQYSLAHINDCSTDRSLEYVDDFQLYSPSAWVWVLVAAAAMIGMYLLMWYKWRDIRFFCVSLRNITILSSMRRKEKAGSLMERRGVTTATDPTDEPFSYDVFVSYCDENRNWILDEFLPNVEMCRDIKVCLHERDFQVGLSILENIIFCMDRSRCLLLVISQSFLDSQWCQFEMHLAQHRLLETRRDQLILILLEDVPKRKRSKTLHYLMKTKTYIKWPMQSLEGATMSQRALNDERTMFWRRLKLALVENEWETERRQSTLSSTSV